MTDKETEKNGRHGCRGLPGPGRPKGTPNKATATVRSSITAFVEGNAEQVQELWKRVAARDPGKALEIYAKLAEFCLPKLSRSTIDGEIGLRGRLVIND